MKQIFMPWNNSSFQTETILSRLPDRRNCSLGIYRCRYHDEMCAKFLVQRPFRRPAPVRVLCIYNECTTLRLVNSYMTMLVLRSNNWQKAANAQIHGWICTFATYLVSVDESKCCWVFWIFHLMLIGVSPWTLHWTCTCFPLATEICLFFVVKWAGTVN